MNEKRLPKRDKPSIVGTHKYSPEHLRYTNGSAPFDGYLAGTAHNGGGGHSLRLSVQAMGKQALEVNSMKKKPGRPQESGSVRGIPVFRKPPDAQKLGRAVLKLVEYLDKEKTKEDGHAT